MTSVRPPSGRKFPASFISEVPADGVFPETRDPKISEPEVSDDGQTAYLEG